MFFKEVKEKKKKIVKYPFSTQETFIINKSERKKSTKLSSKTFLNTENKHLIFNKHQISILE